MRANWQECRYYPASRASLVGLFVTLSQKGHIHLSRGTYEKMGEPKAVQVYFDPANNRFGLKQSTLASRNAFPVCKHGPRSAPDLCRSSSQGISHRYPRNDPI